MFSVCLCFLFVCVFCLSMFSVCLCFLFFFRAGTHKMLVRKANMEDPDQTADLGLLCLSVSFWQPTSVLNDSKYLWYS